MPVAFAKETRGGGGADGASEPAEMLPPTPAARESAESRDKAVVEAAGAPSTAAPPLPWLETSASAPPMARHSAAARRGMRASR